MFHEFVSAIFAIALLAYIIFVSIKNRILLLKINPVTVFAAALPLLYLLTSIWAIDSGMAILGFIKLLPLPLFLIAFMQTENSKEAFFDILPIFAVFMTVISAILMQIPVIAEYFSVAGRLAGFFQYSNTFALFLLIALIFTLFKDSLKIKDYVFSGILIGGIIYSGSRTVMITTVLSIIVFLIFHTNKRTKLIFSAIFFILIILAVIYAAISGDFDDIGRFLRISFTESTFLGRILYYKDAIPQILKNPFGLGYLGYHYTQQAFQTSFYSVQFVHNDFLQIMLDVGIAPAAAFVAVIAYSFFKKRCTVKTKLSIFVITAHILFDFDLQFVSVFVLFLLLLDNTSGKVLEIKSKGLILITAVILTVTSLYFGTVQFLSFIGQNEKAFKLYPWHTISEINLLKDETNAERMNRYADSIINRNEYVSLAYSAKARYAYSKGDFASVISYKNDVFNYAPYQIDDYNEYATMLIIGIQLYEQNGDSYSADYCRKELLKIPQKLNELEKNTDPIAFKLRDKPKFDLEAQIIKYIKDLEVSE